MPLYNYSNYLRDPTNVLVAAQQGRENAQRNALFDYKFNQAQQQDAASAAEEQAWEQAVQNRDIQTMLQIDPETTQLLQQHWESQRMSGLGDVGVYRKPMEVPQEATRPNIVQQGGYSYMFDPSKGIIPGSVQAPQRAPIEGPTSEARNFALYSRLTPEQRALYDKVNGKGAAAAAGNGAGLNDRQVAGFNMVRENAIMYASNVTGLSRDEIEKVLAEQGPDAVAKLINEKGKRSLQGATARVLSAFPLGKTFVEAQNADLIAPAKGGGAGIALTQNPTGPVATADFQAGEAQFPNPTYPLDTQAEMVRQMLINSDRMTGGGQQQAGAVTDPLGIR